MAGAVTKEPPTTALAPLEEIARAAPPPGSLVIPEQTKERLKVVLAVVLQAAKGMIAGVAVTSAPEHQMMVDELRLAKANMDTLDDFRKAMTRPIDAEKASVMDIFRPTVEGLAALIDEGKQNCLAFTTAENARIAAEQRARERVAQVERDRLAAEARALADQAEAAAQADPVQAGALMAEAQALHQQAVTTVAPVYTGPARSYGSSTRPTFAHEVSSKRRFVQALLTDHPDMFDAIVELKDGKIKSWVALHNGGLKVDGLTITASSQMAIRK